MTKNMSNYKTRLCRHFLNGKCHLDEGHGRGVRCVRSQKRTTIQHQDTVFKPIHGDTLANKQRWIVSVIPRLKLDMPTKEEFDKGLNWINDKNWRDWGKRPRKELNKMRRFRLDYQKMRNYAGKYFMLPTFKKEFLLLEKNVEYNHYIMSKQKQTEYEAGLPSGTL